MCLQDKSTAVKPCVFLQAAGNGDGVLSLSETETQVRCCILDKSAVLVWCYRPWHI